MDRQLSQHAPRRFWTRPLEAEQMKDEFVSLEHILLAATEEKGGEAVQILAGAGITRDAILTALVDIRGGQRITDANPEDKYQALERFSQDLTAKRLKNGASVVARRRPRRSPSYVNHTLRETSAFLNAMRRQGRTPLLSRDEIADVLRSLTLPRSRPRPLSTGECRKLLQAALRHDAVPLNEMASGL